MYPRVETRPRETLQGVTPCLRTGFDSYDRSGAGPRPSSPRSSASTRNRSPPTSGGFTHPRPSTDLLIKLAEAFDVTLDYLAFEAKGQAGPVQIHDRELLRRFETVDKLPDGDKSLAKEILDLVIMKNRFKELVDTGGK